MPRARWPEVPIGLWPSGGRAWRVPFFFLRLPPTRMARRNATPGLWQVCWNSTGAVATPSTSRRTTLQRAVPVRVPWQRMFALIGAFGSSKVVLLGLHAPGLLQLAVVNSMVTGNCGLPENTMGCSFEVPVGNETSGSWASTNGWQVLPSRKSRMPFSTPFIDPARNAGSRSALASSGWVWNAVSTMMDGIFANRFSPLFATWGAGATVNDS